MQGGAEVARCFQLQGQPALLQRIAVFGQIPAPFIATAQTHGDGLGRQHAGLHGGVDPLDAGEVEGAGIATDDQAAGKVHAGQGVPAPWRWRGRRS